MRDLLKKKNPYLFRAKNILTAQELIEALLDAKLSSSEEEIFGTFLENLALYVAQKTLEASKSSGPGIDFEYTKDNTRFLVSIKSGVNWGNSSQWQALEHDFKTASRVLSQSTHVSNVFCILGICYGKARTTIKRGIIRQICGQNFWYMISGDEDFYTEIIEPLGHKAKELNHEFLVKKAELINRFTKQFIGDFCDKRGRIMWDEVVKYNSGNITADDRARLV